MRPPKQKQLQVKKGLCRVLEHVDDVEPNNPGRPIVSACSCPTELISSYLDRIMTPIVKALPSYIKDSTHALKSFRDFNFSGQDKLIFTMDITSLYTVIPNSEGLQALKHFFDQRTVKERLLLRVEDTHDVKQ